MGERQKADSAATLAKVATLIEVQDDLLRKVADVRDEIAELLAGGAGIGAKMKAIQRAFEDAWRGRYKGAYVWHHAIDAPNIKRLVKLLGAEEVEARIAGFIAEEYEDLVRARHPFAWFVKHINSYTTTRALPMEPAVTPSDCRHLPRCVDDVTHTHRMMEERRHGRG